MHRFRVLGSEVVVRCEVPGLDPFVEMAIPRAAEELPAQPPIRIELVQGERLHELRHDGRLVYQHHDPACIAIEIESLVTHLAIGALGGWTRLHAGCARVDGRRALFTGDKASGKTTLLLALLAAGHEVHGDENVLLRDGSTLPVPRRFHLREGSLALLPGLAPLTERLRPLRHPEIGPFRFFDPTDLGRPWRVEAAPAAAVFVVESAFGSASRVDPCAKVDLIRHLLFQTINLSRDPGTELRQLSTLSGSTAAFRLRLGDLDGAVRAVADALGSLP